MRRFYKGMGDVGNIYVDDGQYEAEIFQEYDDDGRTMFQVYRYPLDKCVLRKGKILSSGGHEEWFSDDLKSIAQTSGTSVTKLAKALCGRNPVARFWAYYDIGSHHGFDNLDSYPLTLTEKELEKRERGPTARRLRTARYGYTRPGTMKRRR